MDATTTGDIVSTDPTVTVVAPSLFLSVTIEDGGDDPDTQDIHVHAGGQGIWVARMLTNLGERPVVCAPLGGESGRALHGLARVWDIDVDGVPIEGPSPAYVHDRRGGERRELARSAVPQLDRHEVDELYGRVLAHGLATSLCVITGRWDATGVPTDFYRRLGADLAAAGIASVGDLHADELDAYLDGGELQWLKISEEDLVADSRLDAGEDSEEAVLAAARDLVEHGARAVVVSRSDRPALAVVEGDCLRISGPTLEAVDPTGTGDSMTAALAAALRHEIPPETALRRAWAAGAANVLRHGLGSADRELIDRLSHQVQIDHLESP